MEERQMKTIPPGRFAPVLPTRGLPRRSALSAVAGTLSGIAVASHAQTATDWPNQAVRYINLFPPGGATDALSRIYCAKMIGACTPDRRRQCQRLAWFADAHAPNEFFRLSSLEEGLRLWPLLLTELAGVPPGAFRRTA
jgi:hypothetical protein